MTNKTIIESVYPYLEGLGLTENDLHVYTLLLERGTVLSGSAIANRTSLPRQYVYNSLKKLAALNLIEEVLVGKRTRYKALSTQYLISAGRKQLENTEAAARTLERISAVGAEADFEVYRGINQVFAFEEHVVHNLKENDIQYIIGGGADTYIKFFGAQYEELSKIAEGYGLRTCYVGAKEEEAWLKRAHAANEYFTYRILDNLPQTVVQTVIRFETVTLYTFGETPLVYVVKSKVVADNYKKFFDMLWSVAKA